MARRVSRAMAVREAHKPKRRLHSPVRPPRAQRARPTGGRSPPRHPGGREAAGRTDELRRGAGYPLSLSFQTTLHDQIVPRYKAAKRRRLQRVLGGSL
jgi:hypothetical protein